MPAEQKTCQNCKTGFVIEAADFDFYKKMAVPPPTWCPECRRTRRFLWRNERTFYRNTCQATQEPLISVFAPDSGMTVYSHDSWWSDDWNPLDQGQEYDFKRPFFEQMRELIRKVPVPAVFNARTENCDYSNHANEFKNGYLVSASWNGENISYGTRIHASKDSMDVLAIADCNFCYEAVSLNKCYKTFFSQNCDNCSDSWFLYDCKGCTNCFGCTNLRSKSYHIFNQPYSKEEYFKKLEEMRLGGWSGVQKALSEFAPIKLKALRKYANILNSEGCTGDNIFNCGNCQECFDISNGMRDCKYIVNSLEQEDSYDCYGTGAKAERLYECFDAGVQGSDFKFTGIAYGGTDVSYSFNCNSCSHIFGCAGLRSKQYCILNKQYSKEEYEALVPRIMEHMNEMPYVDGHGRTYKYGEFFPPDLSPFAYNETVAQEYAPLGSSEAAKTGFRWKEQEEKKYEVTLAGADIPDNIEEAEDGITKEVIACSHSENKEHPFSCESACTTAFKIIPQELQFLRQMKLPLPRTCPNCRHYKRLAQRTPLKLWTRDCMCEDKIGAGQTYHKNATQHFHGDNHCPNKFQTSYAPDRPETVYCAQCYQSEVV